MGVLTAAAKAAAKAAKAKKVAAKLAAAKKKAAAKKTAAAKKAKIKKDYAAYVKQFPNQNKVFAKSRLAKQGARVGGTGAKIGDKSKFATPKQIKDAEKKGMLLSNDPDIDRKIEEAAEIYESGRLDSFTNPPDRSTAGAKRAKAKAAIKSQKPKTKSKKTFLSEMRELKSKLMTAAAFQREASKLAVKYGKTIKIAGKVFGPKKKK
tara:strand:+ start:107 stop:727 length:621 start_codon:yes stop_codon:yes gene_type:complete